MNAEAARVEVGRIVAVHGVRGGIRLESWTEPRTRIFSYQPWTLVWPDGTERSIEGACAAGRGKGVLARLPGFDDRDQAATLIGARIFVPRAALPALDAGEHYWTDLEDLQVLTREGVNLGRVSHLLETGANDVLVVVDDDGRQRLLPWAPGTFVLEVDLAARRMVVDWDPEF